MHLESSMSLRFSNNRGNRGMRRGMRYTTPAKPKDFKRPEPPTLSSPSLPFVSPPSLRNRKRRVSNHNNNNNNNSNNNNNNNSNINNNNNLNINNDNNDNKLTDKLIDNSHPSYNIEYKLYNKALIIRKRKKK